MPSKEILALGKSTYGCVLKVDPHLRTIMSKKTLSSGTLSLRFMQNAHRAVGLAEVEVEQAEVKDDGKWEVSNEVKESWGMTAAPQ
jgi:hypothetical protein